MKQYEVTFIVDPVLSGDEINTTAKSYEDMLKANGAEIVYFDEMGLRQLAYPINRRSSGIYYCIEYKFDSAEFIEEYELAMRRDDRIMRFLTVRLDRHGVQYNEDKRSGKIGKAKRTQAREKAKASEAAKERSVAKPAPTAKPKPTPEPAPKPAPAAKVATEAKAAPVAKAATVASEEE